MIGSKKTKAVEPELSFADRLGKVKINVCFCI